MTIPTALVADFAVQTLAGIVGVFTGVVLALVVERHRRELDTRTRDAELMREFERATDTILGSVLKNTAEAKRIRGLLTRRKGQGLIHSRLEVSVWNATQNQFMALCRNVDERVIFAQFFDGVQRLQAFADFHRSLQLSLTTAKLDPDEPELHKLVGSVDQHLSDLAEDVRFCGVLLVNDHGHPVHKRLLGIKTVTPATPSKASKGTEEIKAP